MMQMCGFTLGFFFPKQVTSLEDQPQRKPAATENDLPVEKAPVLDRTATDSFGMPLHAYRYF